MSIITQNCIVSDILFKKMIITNYEIKEILDEEDKIKLLCDDKVFSFAVKEKGEIFYF